MSTSSCGSYSFALKSYKLGIEVALWHQNMSNIKACKVCDEGLEDEYTSFLQAWHIMKFKKSMMTY